MLKSTPIVISNITNAVLDQLVIMSSTSPSSWLGVAIAGRVLADIEGRLFLDRYDDETESDNNGFWDEMVSNDQKVCDENQPLVRGGLEWIQARCTMWSLDNSCIVSTKKGSSRWHSCRSNSNNKKISTSN